MGEGWIDGPWQPGGRPVCVIGLLKLKRGEESASTDDEHAQTMKKYSLKRARAAAAPTEAGQRKC